MEDYTTNKKLKNFGMGAGIGIAGSILSMLSKELTKRQLGYSPMTIGSTVKVALASGISTLAFLAAVDYIEAGNKKKFPT